MSSMSEADRARVGAVAALHARIAAAVSGVVIGQDAGVRLAAVTILCRGHSLIEGVPGLGKTLLVRTLASCLGIRFGRVQFTPDLMPSDVIGTPVLDTSRGEARFRPGPLFTDLLLADEINRAPAKTQAALLEAMQERSATVDGASHPLGPHFTVFATQNPVEHEGTYPLPEAELDRFLFKIVLDYPAAADERALLVRHHAEDSAAARAPALIAPDELEAARAAVRSVRVGDEIVGYVANLVRATRTDARFSLGASPRAGLLLLRAAKALAALAGRDFVLPEDVQEAWPPTLRHRVVLEPGAEVEGLRADEALRAVLESVTVPR
jgi:MoxR-like ATPase